MSWKYGLVEKEENGVKYLEVTEVYDKTSFLKDSICLCGDTPENIINDLKIILQDLENDLIIVTQSNKEEK